MKYLICFAALTTLCCSGPLVANEDFINACTKTVQNYALYRDTLNAHGYASSFTQDGVFATPGKTFRGRDEIRSYINSQPKDIKTLHHITTKQVSALNNTDGEGTIYALVNFHKNEHGKNHLFRSAQAIYTDQYKFDNNRCEIAHRSLEILTDTHISK